MADAIGQLGLDTKDFEKGIDTVSKKLDSLKAPIKGVDKEVNLLGASLKSLAAVFSIGAVTGFVKSIVSLGGELSDTASTLNLTAESVQELNYAFGQSGAKSEDVTAAIVKLNQSLEDARQGNAKTIETFEKLGITWEDIARDSPEEILMKMADGSANATDKVAALDAIVNLLGKSGKKLAAGLSEGADGIRKLREESTKLTNEEVKALDDFGDAWDRLINKIKVKGAQAIMGGLRQLVNGPDTWDKNKKAAEDKKISDLFASAPLPGSKDYDDSAKAGTPKDPRVVAKELADEKARLNDEEDRQQASAKQEAQETEKRNEDINKEEKSARDEEMEDNAHLLEQERKGTEEKEKQLKIATELTELNRKALFDEKTSETIQKTKQKGDYAGSDAMAVRKQYTDKLISAKERGATEEELRAIRNQRDNTLRDVQAGAAQQTPADRRVQRNYERKQERDSRRFENREKDLDQRANREFERDPKTGEIKKDEDGNPVPKRGRGRDIDEHLDRKATQRAMDKEVDKTKEKKFEGFSQKDSENINKIATALSNENKK